MMNSNESYSSEQSIKGAIGPLSVDKLKEYGKKSYTPLLNVVFKYQDQFTPYLEALAKGLQGGVEGLSKENSSEVEKYVSQLFREAADGINQASLKLKEKKFNELSASLSTLASNRPGVMFSTSYIAGVFFGRLAKHVISKERTIQ